MINSTGHKIQPVEFCFFHHRFDNTTLKEYYRIQYFKVEGMFIIRIRLRFSKSGALRFIGHLDFLRVFQQTIRRAGLPAAFSQGFNPHLLLSFALPLSLGMESVNDYADLTLENELDYNEIVEKLNATAPGGLLVKSAYPAENKAASVVVVADYYLRVTIDPSFCHAAVEKILQAETLVFPKKTKKGIKDTNIRQDILSINIESEDLIILRLSAGSERFLNPLTVAELLCNEKGEKPSYATITRLELYQQSEKGLITL